MASHDRATTTSPPKRVAGGIVVRAKSRKKRKAKYASDRTSSSTTSSSSPPPSSGGVPAILASAPPPRVDVDGGSSKSSSIRRDEFDDRATIAVSSSSSSSSFGDLPSDALMCLRAYTSPPPANGFGHGLGAMSETCAYCPIFSYPVSGGTNDVVCGAAPFLTRGVLLNSLVGVVSSSSSSSSTRGCQGDDDDDDDEYERKRTHAEREVRRLVESDAVRPLHLHGLTAGIDDDDDDVDVAMMETSVYVDASRMALECAAAAASRSSSSPTQSTTTRGMTMAMPWEEAHFWFSRVLLPRFRGRTWAASRDVEESGIGEMIISWGGRGEEGVVFPSYADARDCEGGKRGEEMNGIGIGSEAMTRCRYSATQRGVMIQQLAHAGLLLPKRHIGPGRDCEQYWFSLPGLGRAAGSIERGRSNVLRRLRSCPNGEKGRTALERDIERSIVAQRAWQCNVGRDDGKNDDGNGAIKKGVGLRYYQSGKFAVMDLLAKGWIRIHKTCTGEEFVRLAE